MDKQLRIAVLMGGTSFERDFSLASGRNIVRALEAAGHTVLPLDTSPALVPILREQRPDVVYSALHGSNGEDGTIQSLLEYLHIPYVGQRPSVCRLAWTKAVLPHVVLSHRRAAAGGALAGAAPGSAAPDGPASWPEYLALNAASFKDMGAATALDLVPQWFAAGYPLAVKPMRGGSAMGVARVDDEGQLAAALLDALSFDDEVFIEEWIEGVEMAVAVVGSGETARALPPVEIVPREGFFSTQARLDADLVEYFCPPRPLSFGVAPAAADGTAAPATAPASPAAPAPADGTPTLADAAALVPASPETSLQAVPDAAAALEQVTAAALEVHRAFGCRDLSRVDLIWDGERPRVLEINTSPGMTEYSLVPIAASAAQLPLPELLEELLLGALER
ncbi:MAG: D-alanine--D-alanine ligase [Coriobacteriales bacterium]|jgi:D-alanine-D-alanine ligase|nr:D-alanine--D-alanine ligase [Coriobacteriales bacterium]